MYYKLITHKTLLLAFFLAILSLQFSRAGDDNENYNEQIQQIRNSELASPDLLKVLLILESAISDANVAVPHLREELKGSMSVELSNILGEVNNAMSKEYKVALLSVRLLELSQKMHVLPFRSISKDGKERNQAREQYGEFIALIQKRTSESLAGFDKSTVSIIRDSLCPIFERAQHNLFQNGYGNPLTTQERDELNRLVTVTIEQSSQFAQKFKNTGLPATEIRNIAKIVREGCKNISDFFQKRDMRNVDKVRETLSRLIEKDAALLRKLQSQLAGAEQKEIDLVINRAREEGDKMIRENDPSAIEKQVRIEQQLDNEWYERENTFSSRIISAIFMTIGVILILVFVIRKMMGH